MLVSETWQKSKKKAADVKFTKNKMLVVTVLDSKDYGRRAKDSEEKVFFLYCMDKSSFQIWSDVWSCFFVNWYT
jgi:hypothetical protein